MTMTFNSTILTSMRYGFVCSVFDMINLRLWSKNILAFCLQTSQSDASVHW